MNNKRKNFYEVLNYPALDKFFKKYKRLIFIFDNKKS